MVPVLPGTGPGTAWQRQQGREGKGREGKEGRKGRKEEGKERASGADRMDGWMDREESKRSSGVREGLGSGKIRRERVAWTTVFEVCFIDHTWWRITWATAGRKLCQDVDVARRMACERSPTSCFWGSWGQQHRQRVPSFIIRLLLWIDEAKANIKPIYECRCNERL